EERELRRGPSDGVSVPAPREHPLCLRQQGVRLRQTLAREHGHAQVELRAYHDVDDPHPLGDVERTPQGSLGLVARADSQEGPAELEVGLRQVSVMPDIVLNGDVSSSELYLMPRIALAEGSPVARHRDEPADGQVAWSSLCPDGLRPLEERSRHRI